MEPVGLINTIITMCISIQKSIETANKNREDANALLVLIQLVVPVLQGVDVLPNKAQYENILKALKNYLFTVKREIVTLITSSTVDYCGYCVSILRADSHAEELKEYKDKVMVYYTLFTGALVSQQLMNSLDDRNTLTAIQKRLIDDHNSLINKFNDPNIMIGAIQSTLSAALQEQQIGFKEALQQHYAVQTNEGNTTEAERPSTGDTEAFANLPHSLNTTSIGSDHCAQQEGVSLLQHNAQMADNKQKRTFLSKMPMFFTSRDSSVYNPSTPVSNNLTFRSVKYK